MAHALWHIEPSFYGKYWKDKLMGGAMAAQENVMNPLLDRVVGTAPGIPPRPFFGQGYQPNAPFAGEQSARAASRPVTRGQAREATQNEMGFLSSLFGRRQAATPTAPPASMNNLSSREQAIAAQVRAADTGNRKATRMNLATPPADPAFVSMMRGQPNPYEPSGPLTSVPIRATAPAASTARGYLPIDTLPRVKHSAPAAMGPGGLPADVRHTGAHTQYNPPTGRVRGPAGPTGDIGKIPKGPLKEQMQEAATPATEDEKIKRMLKMMFLSDLIKGTDAPSPDYYSAISVGPSSRGFAPLPSMFRGS